MEKIVKDFVEKVKEKYAGKVTIVLFGSRARGDYWPSSDYDFMVFLERVEDKIEEAYEIYRLKRGFSADIIVLSKDELKDRIIEKMLEDKIVIYDGLGLFR
ncbi:nucleotidyltransferase domain-containing protein [Acidianus sp. HS-5]|uniref:nucleotidyltransferase domain-containing protein n=1 Tax=Acidianus sp. HS-5 TaxID=2886040 RepID=UPI001F19C855|nr:nucleotidyltransferase domain-containing protein [Acidianus sp. HS-5]BDC18950.1 DNA polymerase subunit beta [Acidianus sp. HS-5]